MDPSVYTRKHALLNAPASAKYEMLAVVNWSQIDSAWPSLGGREQRVPAKNDRVIPIAAPLSPARQQACLVLI